MRAKALTAALLVSAACGGVAWAEDASVTLQDRKALSLTVYNGGTGLVRDTRTVAVPAGRSVLAFVDVAAQIQAETALLKGAPFDVLEQNFDFDLLSPEKLLEKSVGRTVRLVRTNPGTGAETTETATVLGATGGVVLKIGDRVETMSGANSLNTRLLFDSLPANYQTIMVDAAREAAKYQRALNASNAGKVVADLKKSGMQVIENVDMAPFQKIVSGEIAKTFGEKNGMALLKAIEDTK